MVTESEGRAAIERELGLTMDVQTRDMLIEALRLGPGSAAWTIAMFHVEMRETMRAIKTSPRRERNEVWSCIDRELDRRRRRGAFVALTSRVMLAALIIAAGFLLGYWGIR